MRRNNDIRDSKQIVNRGRLHYITVSMALGMFVAAFLPLSRQTATAVSSPSRPSMAKYTTW